MPGPKSPTVAERFWAKVDRFGPLPTEGTATGPCWIWTGAKTSSSYGNFKAGPSRWVSAHRYAYELTIGPIPAGMVADHLCRRHECCNPAHIEPVSNAENLRRGTNAQRDKTECINGHPFDEANTAHYNGRRVCRSCKKANARRARSVEAAPRNLATCKSGHAYTEANTYHRPDGARACRTCAEERRRAYRERYRAAHQPTPTTYGKAA